MLRAYANRAMALALMFGVIAMGSLAFAVYVRLQPPTVVRVEASGESTAFSPNPGDTGKRGNVSFHVAASGNIDPDELESKAIVRRFLTVYLNYTPATAERSFTEALNMMTGNLRTYSVNKLRDDEVLAKIKANNMVSTFKVRSIELVKGSPYSFMAFGVKEIHQLRSGVESTDRIVSRHHLRLAVTGRSGDNPSGLLVAEYWEQQILGDRNTGVLQESTFGR